MHTVSSLLGFQRQSFKISSLLYRNSPDYLVCTPIWIGNVSTGIKLSEDVEVWNSLAWDFERKLESLVVGDDIINAHKSDTCAHIKLHPWFVSTRRFTHAIREHSPDYITCDSWAPAGLHMRFVSTRRITHAIREHPPDYTCDSWAPTGLHMRFVSTHQITHAIREHLPDYTCDSWAPTRLHMLFVSTHRITHAIREHPPDYI